MNSLLDKIEQRSDFIFFTFLRRSFQEKYNKIIIKYEIPVVKVKWAVK